MKKILQYLDSWYFAQICGRKYLHKLALPQIFAKRISKLDSLKRECALDYSRFYFLQEMRVGERAHCESSLNFYLDKGIRKFVGVLRRRRSRNFMALRYNFDDIPNSLSTATWEKKTSVHPFEKRKEAKRDVKIIARMYDYDVSYTH